MKKFFFSILFGCVLFFGDFLYIKFFFNEQFPRNFTNLVEAIGLVYLFTLAFHRKTTLLIMSLILFLSFVQMCHLAWFGNFIHPTRIYLFFREYAETFQTLVSIGRLMIAPIVILICSGILLYLVSPILPDRKPFLFWKVLIFLSLIYAPARTLVNGNEYGKQPDINNLGYNNLYASFSYFLGKTLPFKLSERSYENDIFTFQKIKENPQINIVLVIGESLRYQNMSLFGYDRETTPLLTALSKERPFIFRKAVAAGVQTDVALPLFFNNYMKKNPMPVILSQNRCLFKAAKENGFETSFLSAQSKPGMKHIINYLCPKFIDHLDFGTDEKSVSDFVQVRQDDLLVEKIKEKKFDKPQFYVLHQRGSHTPFESRYPKSFNKFPVVSSDNTKDSIIKHYDNSVYFTDFVLSEIIKELYAKSKLPTYFVFVSDHGQTLGEDGAWGHINLNTQVFKIPFIFISDKKDEVFNQVEKFPNFISHKTASNLIVSLLGYKAEETSDETQYITGADLDGLEGGMRIKITNGEIVEFERVD